LRKAHDALGALYRPRAKEFKPTRGVAPSRFAIAPVPNRQFILATGSGYAGAIRARRVTEETP